jgi:hypothetical protein
LNTPSIPSRKYILYARVIVATQLPVPVPARTAFTSLTCVLFLCDV